MLTVLNSKRKNVEFEVGYQVMLSTENILLKSGPVKKLAPKFLGPLTRVKKHANGLAYQLKMPASPWCHSHTFHISLLKRYVPDVFNRQDTRKTSQATKNFMNISELLNPEQ